MTISDVPTRIGPTRIESTLIASARADSDGQATVGANWHPTGTAGHRANSNWAAWQERNKSRSPLRPGPLGGTLPAISYGAQCLGLEAAAWDTILNMAVAACGLRVGRGHKVGVSLVSMPEGAVKAAANLLGPHC